VELSRGFGKKVFVILHKHFHFALRASRFTFKFGASTTVDAPPKKEGHLPLSVFAFVIHGIGIRFPNQPALLGFPTNLLVCVHEVLGYHLGGCLGLGVLEFEVFHSFYLLFFCTLIIL
jgi:hypothetical protein